MLSPVYVIHANGYDSRVTILRGTASILASITGLLLVYGITFARRNDNSRSDIRRVGTGNGIFVDSTVAASILFRIARPRERDP